MIKTIKIKIDLTPEDVVGALRSFTAEEWHHFHLEMQRLLIEENAAFTRWFNLPWADAEPFDFTIPPETAEGDREALAAAEELFHIFDNLDPQIAKWGATSDELTLENSYFWSEDSVEQA